MKQADYWKNRFTQLEDAQNNKALDYYDNLEKQFTLAAQKADKELASWYARYAKNEGISFTEAKQVLTKGELSAFKMSVEDYIAKGKTLKYSDQWAKELERASAKFHVTRLESLQLQMQQQIEVMYGYELDTFDKFIADQYKAGYYKTMFELQKGFGVGFDVMKLDDKKIAKLIAKPWAKDGMNFSDRIWRDKNKLMAEMTEILTQATIRGDGYAKTTKLLAERFNVSKSQAKNLVITESAFFSSEAQTDCFNILGVKQYEIIATLDGKTSPICKSLDGKVFDMQDRKSGITCPPFHGRCRTTTAPFFNDEFELNTKRAARDPDTGKTYRVPADMKYPDWEKSFVEGGKKDGLEFVKGGIIIPEIISGALNPASKQAEDHAKLYYESVRKMKNDVSVISQNTAFEESAIQEIKDYIFLEKHDLGKAEKEYFYPDFMMAQTWQRLIDGKDIQKHDLTLLRHEIMEKELINNGMSQYEAHRITSKKFNYDKEAKEYYANIEKNK